MKQVVILSQNHDFFELIKIALKNSYHVFLIEIQDSYKKNIGLLQPDTIISDLNLNSEKKINLIKSIKSEFSNIPLIMLNPDSNVRKTASYCCADFYLEKPFRWNDLKSILEKASSLQFVNP